MVLAAAEPDALYPAGDQAFEFQRTASRLEGDALARVAAGGRADGRRTDETACPVALRAAAVRRRGVRRCAAKDRGAGGHDAYFAGLQAALKRAGVAQPTLVIDRARLGANIAAVRARAGARPRWRCGWSAKSLPAPALLDAVLAGPGSSRLMVFNGVMLDEMVALPPGRRRAARPAAAGGAGGRLRRAATPTAARRPPGRSGWSTAPRGWRSTPRSPAPTTRRCGSTWRSTSACTAAACPTWRRWPRRSTWSLAEPLLEITGLMGYDAHAAGAASPAAEVARVHGALRARRASCCAEKLGDAAGLTLNTAGSPTYALHLADPVRQRGLDRLGLRQADPLRPADA